MLKLLKVNDDFYKKYHMSTIVWRDALSVDFSAKSLTARFFPKPVESVQARSRDGI